MTAQDFINEWIGVPYDSDGRDKRGIDCWGLVRQFYHDVVDLELPDWKREDHSQAWIVRLMSELTDSEMRWISMPVNNCLAIGQRKVGAWHVGIFFSHQIFHVMEGSRVHCSPIELAVIEFGGRIKYGVPLGS